VALVTTSALSATLTEPVFRHPTFRLSILRSAGRAKGKRSIFFSLTGSNILPSSVNPLNQLPSRSHFFSKLKERQRHVCYHPLAAVLLRPAPTPPCRREFPSRAVIKRLLTFSAHRLAPPQFEAVQQRQGLWACYWVRFTLSSRCSADTALVSTSEPQTPVSREFPIGTVGQEAHILVASSRLALPRFSRTRRVLAPPPRSLLSPRASHLTCSA
jgi:hypothetical protein